MMCECGRPVEDGRPDQGCLRCRFLDGYDRTEHRIIAALREIGYATLNELASASGLNVRTFYREPMQRLIARGRVVSDITRHDGHAAARGQPRRTFRLRDESDAT